MGPALNRGSVLPGFLVFGVTARGLEVDEKVLRFLDLV